MVNEAIHQIDTMQMQIKSALDNIKLYIKSIGSYEIQFTCIVIVRDNFSWVPNCSLESPNAPILENCIIDELPRNHIFFIFQMGLFL